VRGLAIGPHIVPAREQYLEQRVRELKDSLDLAQQRIDELERALGLGDDITPLRLLGLTPSEARFVNLLYRNGFVTKAMAKQAVYVDEPDRAFEVQDKIIDVIACRCRQKFAAFGIAINGRVGRGNCGHVMLPADQARLRDLLAARANEPGGLNSHAATAKRRQRASNGVSLAAAE
jgi:hypothetical protein